MRQVVALIVAAGVGERFGGDVPKVFATLAGRPVLAWALQAYDACTGVDRTVVAVGAPHISRAQELVAAAGLGKPVAIIAGGRRRQDTVVAGLQSMADDSPDLVAIHDGARPLTDCATIAASIQLAEECGACVTATPVTDTIKRADSEGSVVDTPERQALWRAQTPQTFRYELIRSGYQRAQAEGWEVTDDAAVLERCGICVHINPGPASNLKVTTRDDLLHAELVLAARRTANDEGPLYRSPRPAAQGETLRVGSGYDVHALAPDRRLVLGGVEIPHALGLAGHSDADVLLHAICDAVLGAAAAGDIGALFPDTDPALAGIDSTILCRRTSDHVRQLGFEVANVDATVIAQRPRLAPHIPAMRLRIAAALGIAEEQVSVKATTTERLGFAGREEGIAAEAVVLLRGR